LPILANPAGKRSDGERNELAKFFKENYAEEYLRAEVALAKSKKTREELAAQIPTSMIMEDMDPPRQTFALRRGDYQNPGDKVSAATPAFLPKLEGPVNRLTLARWLGKQGTTAHPARGRESVLGDVFRDRISADGE